MEAIESKTQDHRTNLLSGILSIVDFSLSSDEYLEAGSSPHSDKNNMFLHL